jgi:phosphate transport system permease protein
VLHFGLSGLAGAFALACLMLPIVIRSSYEMLRLVPNSLREGSYALGATKARVTLTVVLPAAVGGIVSGALLAVARAAGETAPLLICDSIGFNPFTTQLNLFHGVPSVSMFIYTSYDLPLAQAVTRAWGAAFVLMMLILIANVLARLILARSRAKMGR